MFIPVSNTKLVPTAGNIVIRVDIKDYSTLGLMSKSKMSIGESTFTIDGTSIETLPLNKKVVLAPHLQGNASQSNLNFINLKDNKRSMRDVSKAYEELTNSDKDKFRQANPKVDLIEYAIVNQFDIIATIDD